MSVKADQDSAAKQVKIPTVLRLPEVVAVVPGAEYLWGYSQRY